MVIKYYNLPPQKHCLWSSELGDDSSIDYSFTLKWMLRLKWGFFPYVYIKRKTNKLYFNYEMVSMFVILLHKLHSITALPNMFSVLISWSVGFNLASYLRCQFFVYWFLLLSTWRWFITFKPLATILRVILH